MELLFNGVSWYILPILGDFLPTIFSRESETTIDLLTSYFVKFKRGGMHTVLGKSLKMCVWDVFHTG